MRRVVITGMGCISPVGNNVTETWNSLLEGRSGAAPITRFDTSQHKTRFAAEVKGFDAAAVFGVRDARRMDRFTQFAIAAAMEALAQSGLTIDDSNRDRIGVVIGTGIGGISTLIEQWEVMKRARPGPRQSLPGADDDLGQRGGNDGHPLRRTRPQYGAGNCLCLRE